MATKKFIIEVEEGFTICHKCPMSGIGCKYIDCHQYNLATMKIKELEEKENEQLLCQMQVKKHLPEH